MKSTVLHAAWIAAACLIAAAGGYLIPAHLRVPSTKTAPPPRADAPANQISGDLVVSGKLTVRGGATVEALQLGNDPRWAQRLSIVEACGSRNEQSAVQISPVRSTNGSIVIQVPGPDCPVRDIGAETIWYHQPSVGAQGLRVALANHDGITTVDSTQAGTDSSLLARPIELNFGLVRAALLGPGGLQINSPPAPAKDGPEPQSSPSAIWPFAAEEAHASIAPINAAGDPPATWPLGFPLGLTSTKSIAGKGAKAVKWEVSPPWLDRYSFRINDGRDIIIGTGTKPITITVTLVVAKGDTVDLARKTFELVADPDPDPSPPTPSPNPPAPRPGPEPTPSPQSGDGVAEAVRSAFASVALAAATRSSEARSLAAGYRAVASQAAAGAIATPAELVSATRDRNKAALGTDLAAWAAFGKALEAKLADLARQAKLGSIAEHVVVWGEIAAALEEASK